MKVSDLKDKKVFIWGLGREGKAAIKFIRGHFKDMPLTIVDEALRPISHEFEGQKGIHSISGKGVTPEAFVEAEVIIKSPGVSLYHPLISDLRSRGVAVTSLLNLWLAEPHEAKVIGVTGTKGKSTTSALLLHALKGLGQKAMIGGNFGIPIVDIDVSTIDFAVIEVSSYQASDLTERFDLAILTSLHPEHLDWHGTKERYFYDKLNLLRHARRCIVSTLDLDEAKRQGVLAEQITLFNEPTGFHVKDGKIFDATIEIGTPKNAHLARPHNLSNIAAVLTLLKTQGFEAKAALATMESYQPLPHRQEELGEKNGVLYVNDSIATAPHAAIAALEVYKNRKATLICGGYDRGIDYEPLIEHIMRNKIAPVILLGPVGKRLYDALLRLGHKDLYPVTSMEEAVLLASEKTAKGGVVLLSPAAPSFGLFRDFVERGESFAALSGFPVRERHPSGRH